MFRDFFCFYGAQPPPFSLKDFINTLQFCRKTTIKHTEKVLIFTVEFRGQNFFVKVYLKGPGIKGWLQQWGKPKALKVWEKYVSFSQAGFKTQMPLGGWINRKKGDSGLIFELLPLENQLANILLRVKEERQHVETIVRKVLLYLQKMHEKGFYIRDPKTSNFFLVSGELLLVDVDSLKNFKKPLPIERRYRNLKVLHRSLYKLEIGISWEELLHLYKNVSDTLYK